MSKPRGVLTEEDYEKVNRLTLHGKGLVDVSLLKKLKNLKYLDIGANPLKDLSPLAGLLQLEFLWVGNYGVKNSYDVPLNLGALGGLMKLQRLRIAGSSIADLSPVCALPSVTRLDLEYCRVQDFRPLTNMKNLKELGLEGVTSVKDNLQLISKLHQLTSLNLQSCDIEDSSSLSSLSKLTDLNLQDNRIDDLGPLRDVVALKKLFLYHNQITELRPLIGMKDLEELYIGRNPVTDFSPLANLSKLTELEVPRGRLLDDQAAEIRKSSPGVNIKEAD